MSSFFHADNYAVVKEIFVIKYVNKEIERRAIDRNEVCKAYGRFQFHDWYYIDCIVQFMILHME